MLITKDNHDQSIWFISYAMAIRTQVAIRKAQIMIRTNVVNNLLYLDRPLTIRESYLIENALIEIDALKAMKIGT